MNIADSVIAGNESFGGGGVINGGIMNIGSSVIESNTANTTGSGYSLGGGGILNGGVLMMRDTTVRLNEATVKGGGIALTLPQGSGLVLLVRDSHIEDNSATAGGGIWVESGLAWLPGTVLIGNSPDDCLRESGLVWPRCH